ncbi:MAG: beta strand repeat-containing protein, partial [Methylophagaceae bacterium]
ISGNLQLNSGSAFSGSGENLFNIPKSALTDDALLSNLITTGSVSASVSQDGFFRVFGTGSVTTELSGSLLVSGNVNLNSGSSFSGSGENLFNIPKSALTDDALFTNLIISGAITASVDPDTGFVVTSIDSGSTFFGDVQLVSGSVFSGSGRDLFDIPRSALTEDADLSNLITTGSVSASVSTDGFFRVFGTGSVTTELSGSVFVSGAVQLNSGSKFSGSGADLFDIPRSALTEDALLSTFITSGSVTASVTPESGFVVTSIDSGSTFSGSIFLSSGSFFSGSGENLFNIPKSALVDDALLSNVIVTGSVTASVTPDGFFRVFGTGSVTTELSGSLFVSGNIKVNSGSSYSGSGENLFNIPLAALSTDAQDAINAVASLEAGILATGSVTASTTDNIFRVTSVDSGSIFSGSVQLSSGSIFSGSGEQLFNIPRSALVEDALISNLITTGSVTASVTPDGIFKVFGSASIKSEFTGSVSITETLDVPKIIVDQISSSFSGSFAGDGSELNNIPLSALSEDAFKIASGSATASISPNLGFVVNTSSSIQGDLSVSGRITAEEIFVNFISSSILVSTGSNVFGDTSGGDTQKLFGETTIEGNITASGVITSSGFIGDGAGLFNIPQSALSEDAFQISSGSITASVSPTDGFVVTSLISGSTFSGSVRLSSGSSFSGSGKNLFEIPLSALSETSPLIASGSVTASTSPDGGFVVTSEASGSTFSGSVFLSSGSFYSGSGAGLFDIPRSAITQEAFRIVSGSVTASVHPTKGFEVNSTGRFDGSVTTSGSLFISSSTSWAPDNLTKVVKVISTDDGNKYEIDGYRQPLIYLVSGSTYIFNQSDVTNGTHPLRFSTTENGTHNSGVPFTGSVSTGSSEAGQDGSAVTITINSETPDTLYYYCVNHPNMGGTINKVRSYPIAKTIIEDTVVVTGSMLVSNTIESPIIKATEFSGSFSGSGRDLFDIPLSALAEKVEQLSFISSGSITASVDPAFGFKVNSSASIEGDTIISGGLLVSHSSVFDNIPVTQSVTISNNRFVIQGNPKPKLKLLDGSSYYFDTSDSSNLGFPFKISQTNDGTLEGGTEYTTDITFGSANPGTTGAYVNIEVTGTTPNILHYYAEASASYGNTIKKIGEVPKISQISFVGDTEITGGFDVSGVSSATLLQSQNVSASFVSSSIVDFQIGNNTYSSVPGRLKWNETDGTLDLGMGGATASLQIGQELYYPYVVNKTGATLENGTLVMLATSQPTQNNRLSVQKAITNGTYTEQQLIGVLTETIENNGQGFATYFGYVKGLKLDELEDVGLKYTGSVWVEGETLYPDPLRAGGLTNVQPIAPNLKSSIATITTISGQNLEILVRPHLGSHLRDLHDVQITSASNNDILVYSATSSRFENRSSDLVLSGSFSGSYSGVYFGDGSNLQNVQAAAAPLISSGSATASVASGDTFIITSPVSGSIITGSLVTSGSVIVAGGGRFEGDGSGLTDIDIANLALTLNTLESGSATASLDDTEFKVFSNNVTTSVDTSLSGSVNISQSLKVGGVITGDGSGITNIDIANLAIDSSKIFTG